MLSLQDQGLPTGAMTVMDIGLSNLSLASLASLASLLSPIPRRLTPTTSYVRTPLFRLEIFSCFLVFVITFISTGVVLTVATETAFHFATLQARSWCSPRLPSAGYDGA